MRSGKLADAKALGQMQLISEETLTKKDDSLPDEISKSLGADVLYRNLHVDEEKNRIRIVLGIAEIIRNEAIIDWQRNTEVQRVIINKIDDFLYDTALGEWGISLTPEEMKTIVEHAIDLAKKNYEIFSV